jgi:hypothetical protein
LQKILYRGNSATAKKDAALQRRRFNGKTQP